MTQSRSSRAGRMTGSLLRLLVLPLLLLLTAPGVPAAASAAPPAEFRAGALIVAYRPGTSAPQRSADQALVGAQTVRAFRSGATLLSVPPGREVATATALRAQSNILYAEPDYLMTLAGVPNDPSFSEQWAAQNSGQTVDGITGTAGADEKAVAAWSVTTGTRSVVIAVLDGGVDYNHPDLAANIWTNPAGINGCPPGTHGYNVLNSTCDPMDDLTVASGYFSHGTRVAGVLGAVGNNGIGIAGVNWTTTILPVKWLDSTAWGTTDELLSAIDWVLAAQAAGVNVRIVNNSATYVGTEFSQALSDEIDLLGQHDILFVTPAGNTSENNNTTARYPCNYDRANKICVAASDQGDALPSWANWGATTVDLAAPGANIYSTERGSTYGFQDGSSFAAPQVAGAAALILSVEDMSATDLKARILDNVDPLPSLTGLVRTGGRLDICKALPGCGTFTLSGSVTAAGTGVVDAWVYAFDAGTSAYVTSTASVTGGAYSLVVPPGSYKIYVQPRNGTNPDQWYGGATPTVVPVSADTPGVDIALAGPTSFTLSGSVTAAGTGVVDAWVYAFDAGTSAYVTSTASVTGGAYSLVVPPGSYKIYVQPRNGTNPDQWYGGATPTVVPVSADTPGVDIALAGPTSFTLSGSVTAAGTGVVDAWVYAFDAGTSAYVTSTASVTGGAYSLVVPPGSYKIYVQPRNGTNPDQWYGGATPTVVPVSADTPGVDIALAGPTSFTLSGSVTAAGTGVVDAWVYAFDAGTSAYVTSTASVTGGAYSLVVPPGSYKIYVQPRNGTNPDQWYGGATPTVVPVSADTPGVDIALAH